MLLKDIKSKIPKDLYKVIKNEKITKLRPAQIKAIKKGLLKGKSLLVISNKYINSKFLFSFIISNHFSKYSTPKLSFLSLSKINYRDFT